MNDADTRRLLQCWGEDVPAQLLKLALTHRSFANEAGGLPTNERLEFLGDAVLQLIVTDRLFTDYPGHPEGHLAKMRAATVSQGPLAAVARKLELGRYILLGRGEEINGGREKDSILSDTMEALIGATYESVGITRTRAVVERHLEEMLEHAIERSVSMDWKTRLGELVRDLELGPISYEVDSSGPDHRRVFTAHLILQGERCGQGMASSKKAAEHEAAHTGILHLAGRYNIEGATSLEGYRIGGR